MRLQKYVKSYFGSVKNSQIDTKLCTWIINIYPIICIGLHNLVTIGSRAIY